MCEEQEIATTAKPDPANDDAGQQPANHAEPDTNGQLSDKQLYAIELFLECRRDAKVAQKVGVTRQTVNSWRNHHPLFMAELKRRWEEISGQALQARQGLLLSAVETYAELLEDYDPKIRRAAAKDISELWLKLDARDAALAAKETSEAVRAASTSPTSEEKAAEQPIEALAPETEKQVRSHAYKEWTEEEVAEINAELDWCMYEGDRQRLAAARRQK